jgi:protein involved in polysaccharide export with SLBB domain
MSLTLNRRHTTIAILCYLAVLGVASAQRIAPPPSGFYGSNAHKRPVVIAPGDVLNVRFYLSPELDRSVKVREDGKISLPFLQGIDVAGQSPDAFQKVLVDLYAKELSRPVITVDIESAANRSIYVTGEVQLPGEKELHGRVTLAMALAMAAVNQKTAGIKSVLLIRADDPNKYSVYKVNGSFGNESARNLILEPGDLIVVPKKLIGKMDDFVEQYVRQLLPATPNAGATLLWEPGSVANSAAATTP